MSVMTAIAIDDRDDSKDDDRWNGGYNDDRWRWWKIMVYDDSTADSDSGDDCCDV